jgi:hypothetical protein
MRRSRDGDCGLVRIARLGRDLNHLAALHQQLHLPTSGNDDRMVSYCGWLRNRNLGWLKAKQNGYFTIFIGGIISFICISWGIMIVLTTL